MDDLAFALKELQGFRDAAKSSITQQVLSDCIAQVDAMLPKDSIGQAPDPASTPATQDGYQQIDAEPTEVNVKPPSEHSEQTSPEPAKIEAAAPDHSAEDEIADLQELLERAQRPRVQQFLERCISELSTAGQPTAGVKLPQVAPQVNRCQFVPLESFGWDQEGSKVLIYVTSGATGSSSTGVRPSVAGVDGVLKDQVACHFSTNSFDLQIKGLNGKNYRLLKQPLEHDVVAEKCKYVVKKNRITITLHKTEGKYGPEHWNNITAKKGTQEKKAKASESDDPGASIMSMMKETFVLELYDDGDDTTRKLIGEAMLKNRNGTMGDMDSMSDVSDY